MIVLNFGHPLSETQLRQLETLTGFTVERLVSIDSAIDGGRPLGPQVAALADACELSVQEWQTLPLLVNPPSLNFSATVLAAELHGRCGYFPAMLRLRPVEGTVPRVFEIAEIVDLQQVRDEARRRRGTD